ncbi:hypothetical protein, partial [Streptomyces rectiviolaceus]
MEQLDREGRGNGMEGESSEADVLRVVEQAMRIRMVWEEVCFTHRGCPFGEVKEALVETAGRWGVP